MNDICVNKHGHNPQSEAANRRVQPHKQILRDYILSFVGKFPEGITCEEMVNLYGLKLQTVSARVSELKAEGKIVKRGIRRGYAVLFLSPTQKELFQ